MSEKPLLVNPARCQDLSFSSPLSLLPSRALNINNGSVGDAFGPVPMLTIIPPHWFSQSLLPLFFFVPAIFFDTCPANMSNGQSVCVLGCHRNNEPFPPAPCRVNNGNEPRGPLFMHITARVPRCNSSIFVMTPLGIVGTMRKMSSLNPGEEKRGKGSEGEPSNPDYPACSLVD